MIIAVVGKGGVGKTTITTLLLRRLLDARETPVLLIDADPSSCLGSAMAIRVEKTLARIRDGMKDNAGRPKAMSQAEWLALQAEDAVVENNGFDLLTMGHPEGKGCYCFVNNLIRDHLARLARSYRHVLLDCEAGLEHLSRRTTGRADILVCVATRSRMSAEAIHRALSIYRELNGGLPRRVDLILNGLSPDDPRLHEVAAMASNGHGAFSQVLTVPHDGEIVALESAGHSLLELNDTSPAASALRSWEIA